MTDTIDPTAGPAPDAGPEAHPRTTIGGAGSFAEHDSPEAGADGPEPASSRVVPFAILALLVAAIVGFFGWWGLFIVVGLLLSIFLHEMGHYLTARQAGMKVTEFFLGFGPKLWSFRRGETEYGIKTLPVGAYVRIIGMSDLDEVSPEDDGRTYREKSYWARLRVVLAGPFMNFAIGFVVLLVLFTGFGQASKTGWHISKALSGSAAAAAGFEKGDQPVSVNGQKVTDWDTFGTTIQHHAGQKVTIVVLRDGHPTTLTPTLGWSLADAGAAKLAPLQSGDEVIRVDGVAVHDYQQLRSMLASAPKGRAQVEFLRDGNAYRTSQGVATPVSLPADGAHGFLGVGATMRMVREGPVQATVTSAQLFASMSGRSVQALGHFFSPAGLSQWTHTVLTSSSSSSNTSQGAAAGVVPVEKDTPPATSTAAPSANSPDNNRMLSILGVLRLGSQAGAAGLPEVLLLLALINIFLGLVNLVPLPPFDGGHAAVATYEAVRERLSGRPYRANMAKLIPVTYAVLMLFGFLFLSTIYLDALHPAKNPFGP